MKRGLENPNKKIKLSNKKEDVSLKNMASGEFTILKVNNYGESSGQLQDDAENGCNKITNFRIKPPLSKVERYIKEKDIMNSGRVQKSGHVFSAGKLRDAGNYLLGPVLGSSPVRSMMQCLGRKKNTDEFYTIKILTVKEAGEESQDDKQGKMLLHTEHSLLSFLNGQPGIPKEHGLFEDYAPDGIYHPDVKKFVGNGKIVRRICLVLDCVIPHPFNQNSSDYINLQHYVIGKGKLKELDALTIFYNIVLVVKSLHDVNVIHRDLKLANLVLNKHNRQIILTNFCLGQHLVSENDKLLDQRGSPAYISPDVLIGKPYLGKPSDMWALGVVLFTMLYGQFPFYHKFHQELFKKIKTAQYSIPSDGGVKTDTLEVIQGLLCLDPCKRSTAAEVLTKMTKVISTRLTPENVSSHDAQVVPEMAPPKEEPGSEEKAAKKASGEKRQPGPDDKNCDILDYFIHRAPVPHTESGPEKKVPHSFLNPQSGAARSNVNYCYSASNGDSSSGSPPGTRAGGISIIEGDIRTFTQNDLFSHRSVFPHYSGPDLFGSWRNSSSSSSSSVPPSTGGASSSSSSSSTPASARPLSRAGPPPPSLPGSLRMPSRLALPSLHIPPSSGATKMYEFTPGRRLALAVLQQINNNPNAKPPLVPQMEQPLLPSDPAVPSTSGLSNPNDPPPSKAASSEGPSASASASSSAALSQPSGSGIPPSAKQSPAAATPRPGCSAKETEAPLSTAPSLEEAGPSTRSGGDEGPPASKSSSLAQRRMKKGHAKLSTKSNLSLRLRMSSSDSDTSSNSSCNSMSSATSTTSIDSNSSSNSSSTSLCAELSLNAAAASAAAASASAAAATRSVELSPVVGQRSVASPPAVHLNHLLPIDDNNNNDHENNHNNDDNNNSDNMNFNVNLNLVNAASAADDLRNQFQDGD